MRESDPKMYKIEARRCILVPMGVIMSSAAECCSVNRIAVSKRKNKYQTIRSHIHNQISEKLE